MKKTKLSRAQLVIAYLTTNDGETKDGRWKISIKKKQYTILKHPIHKEKIYVGKVQIFKVRWGLTLWNSRNITHDIRWGKLQLWEDKYYQKKKNKRKAK